MGSSNSDPYLQMSDFFRLSPLSAQWFPKYTSWKISGKCICIHCSVGCRMMCCLDVTTTRSQLLLSRCRLCRAPADRGAHSKLARLSHNTVACWLVRVALKVGVLCVPQIVTWYWQDSHSKVMGIEESMYPSICFVSSAAPHLQCYLWA